MSTEYIQQFWQQVEAWLPSTSMPASVLAPAASQQELDDLDASLVAGCPEVLRALLGIHNGGGAGWYCFSKGNLLSAAEITSMCSEYAQLAATLFDPSMDPPDCLGAVRPLWWSELWVPFLKRNKEPVCIDLGPAPGGAVGQIIEIDWEGGCNRVLAPDLPSFLAEITNSLPS
jgi:cell wall assembly regulator SMI1